MRLSTRTRQAAAAAALVAAAACGRSDGITAPIQPPNHYPIIFIHGYLGAAATWSSMIARFKADGWTDRELVAWSYDFNQSNAITAQRLATTIDSVLAATGAHHVNLVTHSMGTLPGRYYIRNILPGSDTATKVDAIVSLAGTNHGTALAALCSPTSCVEMRPGSAFLTALNTGDETWGTPRYATWWSPCDEAVSPPSSTVLSGAQNTQTACIGHTEIYSDATVYQQVREWVRPMRYGN
jgi:triacylglycerol lipase